MKLLKNTIVAAAMVATASAYASGVGVVDMKSIFTTAPQVKAINAKLKKQFAPQQKKFEKMSKTLQADIAKLQKNKAVMSKKQLTTLNSKIAKEGSQLHQAQTSFQQQMFAAKQKAFLGFLKQVRAAAAKTAKAHHFDVIIPKNSAVYAASDLDVTKEVLKDLK